MTTGFSPDGTYRYEEERAAWPIRAAIWLEAWMRPYLGWGVLLSIMALAALPAVAVRANRWVALGSLQAIVELSGPLAVACVWLLWGWREPAGTGRSILRWLGLLAIGLVAISQLLLGWLPGPVQIIQAALAGDWTSLPAAVAAEWQRFGTRVLLWWSGVRAGGAAQDNLVFAGAAGIVLWLVAGLSGFLARRTQQGYAGALPSLWLLGVILLYSSSGKYLLITGLALTILLQLLLDHHVLVERWNALRLDYSPGLLLDRVITVVSAAVLVLVVASVMPNLYIEPLVTRYYAVMAPVNERIEGFLESMFPDVRATSRLSGGGLGGGLPNEFLLQGGPDLTGMEVMRVRTNEAGIYESPYEEGIPPGRYMRAGTLMIYDGRGWSNPDETVRAEADANDRWIDEELWGRKLVVQSVILSIASPLLYAAPEPIEASTDVRLDLLPTGDLVAALSRERSYTVVSAVPAVDAAMLRALPEWGAEAPLPPGYEFYLALPDTVTERTRDLAAELTASGETAYDKAAALEAYLRQYEYDLDVPPPPREADDIADFFLFDLQRGYCDYYATAFVVLARLAGLPARFATGFAAGMWDPVENVWIVTEAEAHSWPEVYFPQVGWIAFEPTAGRPELDRIASPQFSAAPGEHVPAPPVPEIPEAPRRWNWQMLVWLMPIALLLWVGWKLFGQWRSGREDPWQALIAWGRRAGRPMAEAETVLEYGSGLADFVVTQQRREPDAGRIVAREVRALSQEVNQVRYGPESGKAAATGRAFDHWLRLRHYLRRLHLGKL